MLVSPIKRKESQALGLTKSLLSLSQPSIFVHPWRKPYWTDHNHTHLFALRNAGLHKCEGMGTTGSTRTMAPGVDISTLSQKHQNTQRGWRNNSYIQLSVTPGCSLKQRAMHGGGSGLSQVMEEIREQKNHNLKTKALSMPGSEWMSRNVLGAEIPWRKHLIKRGRMPIMCSHSCHCNESIILTLLSDPQYAIYANPSCSRFPQSQVSTNARAGSNFLFSFSNLLFSLLNI